MQLVAEQADHDDPGDQAEQADGQEQALFEGVDPTRFFDGRLMHGQRQRLGREPLAHRKGARVISKIAAGRLQMNRNRIVNADLNAAVSLTRRLLTFSRPP